MHFPYRGAPFTIHQCPIFAISAQLRRPLHKADKQLRKVEIDIFAAL